MLVKFGFSALSHGPSFFRRLVLDLVLKTSDSARLVLLKSNEHYAKIDDGGDHAHVQSHSFERSGQICNIWRGCNTKSVARYDHQRSIELRSVHALSAQLARPAPKCHRDLQSCRISHGAGSKVDFELGVVLRMQINQ